MKKPPCLHKVVLSFYYFRESEKNIISIYDPEISGLPAQKFVI